MRPERERECVCLLHPVAVINQCHSPVGNNQQQTISTTYVVTVINAVLTVMHSTHIPNVDIYIYIYIFIYFYFICLVESFHPIQELR